LTCINENKKIKTKSEHSDKRIMLKSVTEYGWEKTAPFSHLPFFPVEKKNKIKALLYGACKSPDKCRLLN